MFEPNILANSHYITQDIGVSLFFFLAYFSLVQVFQNPSRFNFIFHGLCIGLMASSKISAVPFYFASATLLTLFSLRRRMFAWFRKYILRICLSALVCLFVVWSTYFFTLNVIVAPGGNTERVSVKLMNWAVQKDNQVVKGVLFGLRTVHIPLGDYIAVLKNTVVRSTISTPVFFLGTFYPKPRLYFMIVNTFYKTPLPLTLFFVLSLLLSYRNKKLRSTMIILLIPIVSILFVSSVAGMQPLVRYALPLYPFLFIIAGSGITFMHNNVQKVVLLFFLLWYVTSSLSFYPHFISYANELAGPREKLYEKFTDSNLDWGQSLISLKQYVDVAKPAKIHFSYFGRDDAAAYGFSSDFPFGSYKFNEICAFHKVNYLTSTGPSITAISVSNWYSCGYYLDPRFGKNNINTVVGRSILVFNE